MLVKINSHKLQIAMAEVGCNFSALAEASGVSRATLSYIKNGKECSPEVVGKIAKTLNVPVVEIAEE